MIEYPRIIGSLLCSGTSKKRSSNIHLVYKGSLYDEWHYAIPNLCFTDMIAGSSYLYIVSCVIAPMASPRYRHLNSHTHFLPPINTFIVIDCAIDISWEKCLTKQEWHSYPVIMTLYLKDDSSRCSLAIADTSIKTYKEGRLELDVVCEKADKSVPMTTNIAMSHPTIFVYIQTSLVATFETIPVHSDVSFERHVLYANIINQHDVRIDLAC